MEFLGFGPLLTFGFVEVQFDCLGRTIYCHASDVSTPAEGHVEGSCE